MKQAAFLHHSLFPDGAGSRLFPSGSGNSSSGLGSLKKDENPNMTFTASTFPNGNLESSSTSTPVKKRIWLTLDKKLEIIQSHEAGASYSKIARERGMNESSVRTIGK